MEHYLLQFRTKFDEYLREHSFTKAPQELYEPVDYIMQLGGKRLRPLLVLMAYQLFDRKFEKALPVALAVEVFHNFSLVHDDIMDEALIRRGKASVHAKFGLNAGILSGDVMLILVYEYLSKIENASLIPDLIRIFNKVAIEVCEGQQYDINFENQIDVSIDGYLKMIELKTAALMAGALQMGALLGGASIKDLEDLDQFGRLIGIAFQLQDDWLDTFGESEKVGKKIGGDIAQNKKTFLALKALELAEESDRIHYQQLMNQVGGDEEAKINWVTQLFKKLNISEHTSALRDEYRNRAFEHLNQIEGNADIKKLIAGLADPFQHFK